MHEPWRDEQEAPVKTRTPIEVSAMKLVYEYPGVGRRFPYLLFEEGTGSFYKVLLRNRFLYVSHGARLMEREHGELDIPFVASKRMPIGDFVYDSPDESRAAFERVRASPRETLALVLTGHKP
jgi:hypothetical protein